MLRLRQLQRLCLQVLALCVSLLWPHLWLKSFAEDSDFELRDLTAYDTRGNINMVSDAEVSFDDNLCMADRAHMERVVHFDISYSDDDDSWLFAIHLALTCFPVMFAFLMKWTASEQLGPPALRLWRWCWTLVLIARFYHLNMPTLVCTMKFSRGLCICWCPR